MFFWRKLRRRATAGSGKHKPFDLDISKGAGFPAHATRPGAPDESALAQLSAHAETMPRLSPAWHDLQQAFLRGDALKNIAGLINAEPGLAAKVLQVCNSPGIGLRKPINDLPRAIAHLGGNMVRGIAARYYMTGFQRGYNKNHDADALWKHAMAVSALAEIIGRYVPGCNSHEAATLGLFHDVGRMFLNAITNRFVARPSKDELAQHGHLIFEQRGFLVSHVDAGVALTRHWELPEKIQQGIRYHHFPAFAPTDQVPDSIRPETFAVFLADLLAIHLEFPGGNDCKTLPHPSYACLLPRTTLNEIARSKAVSKELWRIYAID